MTEEDKHVEPDAWRKKMNEDDKWTVLHHTNHPDQVEFDKEQPLFSASTIRQLWIDDFKPSIKGEAEELRERGVAEDVAEQLEHLAERFEEVFSSDE